MIEASEISKYYVVRGQKKHVLKHLSLTLQKGERLALMGANGAGKSTLLRLLCGIEKPSVGKVSITGRLSWPVGISGGIVPNLTGKENVKFVCRLFMLDAQEVREKIEFVKIFAELGDYFECPVQTYSTGMRARLSFGLSMAFDFDVYVVDEVLAVGDVGFKKKSREIFWQKAQDKGIIMVSHSVSTVRQFCNRGVFLHRGAAQQGTVDEVIQWYTQETSKSGPDGFDHTKVEIS
jgi:capsular polysaccharide transport system ATP-binding protein